MLTRRGFSAGIGLAAAGSRMLPEMAYAQRAAISGPIPKDIVWLNANEFPEGPAPACLDAMRDTLPGSNRYQYQEFGGFYRRVAASEDLPPEQILVGAGSSEVLHAAVDAFTSPAHLLITVAPTYEGPVETAKAMGRSVVQIPLTPEHGANVRALAAAADKSGGGLIYLCNPNNPTASITPKADIAWLASNLPARTVLLIDEAYIHFGDSPQLESALPFVRQSKDVVVTRTFSKIYGMAGMRVGFAAARPELIERMTPFRNNVISIVSARGVMAALDHSQSFVPERRARIVKTRGAMCDWLRENKLPYIEPQANFMMIDVGREATYFIKQMPQRGVAVGRPFPALPNMLRVTIGTDQEMAKFRNVFWTLYKA